VRSFAANALGEIGSPEPVQRLLEIAENDPVLAVRLWAIEALGMIGDKTVAARLARLLDDPEPRTRALSAEALGRIGATSSIDAIRQRRSGQRWGLRRRYSRALRTLGRELKRT